LLLVNHRVESPQADHREAQVSQVFNNREHKAIAYQKPDVHGEQRFNVAALHEAVKGLLVNLHVRTHRPRVIHRLHKEQVHRRVHLHLETTVVNNAAVVQADHGVKIIKNNWSKAAL
jgi:hypothetical protein